MGPAEKLHQVSTNLEHGTGNRASNDHLSDLSMFSGQKPTCLAERVAARAGFNAPRLNTIRIEPGNLSSSEGRSPYLMLSPALSPTVLLDSPVFLSNSMAQPSPTTGKFIPARANNWSSMALTEASDADKDPLFETADTLPFAFKPQVESSPFYGEGALSDNIQATKPMQSPSSVDMSLQSEQSLQFQNSEVAEAREQSKKSPLSFGDFPISTMERDNDSSFGQRVFGNVNMKEENSTSLDDQPDEEGDGRSAGELNSMLNNGAPAEDGYNWRKYGQKQVKGSECPRSYYKCTHPNCQVKKKVERSQEGDVIEIIYKGGHNHPKPAPNRRLAIGSSNIQHDSQIEVPEHTNFTDADAMWKNSQRGSAHEVNGWMRNDNLDETSLASEAPRSCDPSAAMPPQNGPHAEAGTNGVDVLSTLSNDDEEEEDMGANGSASLAYDGEEDESESKRRKIDPIDMAGASRAIREPRVVVQTTSEVDILDDGYRWRKYGQKVVKGNPNPRSYYKCTNPGCTVRKHVERASHDLKSVITTYEGKHNHDVPAARNSSQASSGPAAAMQSSASHSRVQRPEPIPVQDGGGRFDGSALLGKLNLHARQQLGHAPGFTFGMNQAGLSGLTMASLGPNPSYRPNKLPSMPVNPFLGQQHQHQGNEVGFMALKGEPKSETGLNFHQMDPRFMGR
ncbi:hypothetical protein Sjap_003928 [Stephania japonica]|uniref:WRKY domain-containing protein n=1 Tax=Stephania japonica TaxID=461633 RepID=A0AAP0KPR4_9MAGN